MIKKPLSRILMFCCCTLLIACNTATPERYFDVAVLNSNMLVGFAGEGLLRQLESPSVKMGSDGRAVPMSRTEVITEKVMFLEEDYKKIKGLTETEDAKAILQNARALYDFVLPVLKKEYTQLASLYDAAAPKEQVQSKAEEIKQKYGTHFTELYNALIGNGKLYATKHNINVKWAD